MRHKKQIAISDAARKQAIASIRRYVAENLAAICYQAEFPFWTTPKRAP